MIGAGCQLFMDNVGRMKIPRASTLIRKPARFEMQGMQRMVIVVLLFAAAAMAQPQQTPPAGLDKNAPFQFSHKKHGGTGLQCVFCHETALTAERATFPVEEKCMACHAVVKKDSDAIQQLAAIPKDSRIVPEKTVYKLPEFVNFSHARHTGAKIDCAQCHGDVFQMEVVELKLPMRMKACVDCHKANSAPITCTTCHEAFQQ